MTGQNYTIISISTAFTNLDCNPLHDAMADELFSYIGIELYNFGMVDNFRDILNQRIKSYPFDTRIDKDTEVGTYLHTLDGKPLAITTQEGRKQDIIVKFPSIVMIEKLQKLYNELTTKFYNDIIDFDKFLVVRDQ